VSEQKSMTDGNQEMIDNTGGVLIALVLGFVLGLVVAWLYLLEREKGQELAAVEAPEPGRLTLEPGPAVSEGALSADAEPEPDDLTRVEGIGPKMSSLLAEAGIVTFRQLAASDPAALRQMLRDEGLQFADPGTWPEQAALAAIGAWDALEALQEELSGGRRVG
jgi:predicted flap endonuclease-1-like 5' DNA nuclease